jgi:PKD domain
MDEVLSDAVETDRREEAPVIALGTLAAVIAVTAGPQWSAPLQISASQRALGPELALSRGGHALVVWDQEVGADCPTSPAALSCIHVVTATERPAPAGIWSPPIALNRPGVGARPRPAVNDKGQAAVIWVHDIGVDRVLQATYRRGDPTATWPEPSDLSDDVRSISDHDVRLDPDGSAYVTWREGSSSVRSQWRPVWSGVWDGAKPLSDVATGGPALDITDAAWTEAGRIVWSDIPFGGPNVLLPTAGTAPTGAIDFGGHTVVFTATSSPGTVVEGSICCGFGSTPTVKVIGQARDSGSEPRVAASGIGPVATWAGPQGIEAVDGSVAWSAPVTLARDPAASDPQIAAAESGNAVAVWLSGAGTVQAALRPAATRTWQPAVTISEPGASHPRVAVDMKSDVLVVWNQTTGDNVEVESSSLSASGPLLRLLAPKRAHVHRRAIFDAYALPWFAPIVNSPEWDFGDGKTATGARVQHAYARRGLYTVSVTQTDASGGRTTARVTVTVVPRARRS